MHITLIWVFALIANFAFAQPPACLKPNADEPFFYTKDFHWGMTLEDMGKSFDAVLAGNKRLFARAYFDPALNSYVFPSQDGPVRIDPRFIESITHHLEISLERRYADFVFFPDLGHSHFFVPDSDWSAISKIKSKKDIYEALMNLRSLKILYHTAEQLKVRGGERYNEAFPQDKILLWRYFARNIIGDNDGGENVYPLFSFDKTIEYNTLSELKGHFFWSPGFNIATSSKGCFPYHKDGKTYYFDLSLEDLPYDNSGGDDNR